MKPNFAIRAMRGVGDYTVAEIDTKEATYKGRSWLTLSEFEKRKFENLLILTRPQERVKIIYV